MSKSGKTAKEQLKRHIRLMLNPRAARLMAYLATPERNKDIFDLVTFMTALSTPESQALIQISLLKLMYSEHDSDPVYAWKAIYLTQQNNLALPTWAVSVVTEPAENLLKMHISNHGFKNNIGNVLRMNGQSIKKIRKHDEMIAAYFEVRMRMENNKLGYNDTLEQVAEEFGYGVTTLKNYMKNLKPSLSNNSLPEPLTDFQVKK